jgi:4-amino-4-deoxy-L-arabinose transferase-like glycosyltransferase
MTGTRLSDGARRLAGSPLTLLLVAGPGLVALGICAYQLSLPHAFLGVHGSDDGVYLGPALRLVHGDLPYRDYAFVHPPGIALLMAPLGILGDGRDVMAGGRIITALVAGLNASLAAVAVRSFGRVAMLVAGLGLAVFPLAVSADHTLTLDPYLVLFCLLGTIAMFKDGELANPRRIMVAGALFGFAGAVKAWALFPAIAALCTCIPLWRSAVRPYLSGVLLGFAALSLPFFLVAPGAFVHDVVLAQLNRHATGQGFASVSERLVIMLGLSAPSGVSTKTHLAVILALVVVAFVFAVYFLLRRSYVRLEWFLLAATAIVVLSMLFLVKEFYEFYSYFVVAFGAMLLGVCFGRLAEGMRWAAERSVGRTARALTIAESIALPVLVVVAAVLVLQSGTSYSRSFLSSAYDPQATIAPQVPKGACVVFDEVGNLIDSGRLFSSRPGCPALVDAFGLWLTDNDGIGPNAQVPHSKPFVAKWRSWLGRADYAVLSAPQSSYVPWTPDLISWFNSNYRLAASGPRAYVYQHIP